MVASLNHAEATNNPDFARRWRHQVDCYYLGWYHYHDYYANGTPGYERSARWLDHVSKKAYLIDNAEQSEAWLRKLRAIYDQQAVLINNVYEHIQAHNGILELPAPRITTELLNVDFFTPPKNFFAKRRLNQIKARIRKMFVLQSR